MLRINEFLKIVVEKGGSDAHLKVGKPPGIRIAGEIEEQGEQALSPDDTRQIARDRDDLSDCTGLGDLENIVAARARHKDIVGAVGR